MIWPFTTIRRLKARVAASEAALTLQRQVNEHHERVISRIATELGHLRTKAVADAQEIESLARRLAKAEKNDRRNPKTGRFEKGSK